DAHGCWWLPRDGAGQDLWRDGIACAAPDHPVPARSRTGRAPGGPIGRDGTDRPDRRRDLRALAPDRTHPGPTISMSYPHGPWPHGGARCPTAGFQDTPHARRERRSRTFRVMRSTTGSPPSSPRTHSVHPVVKTVPPRAYRPSTAAPGWATRRLVPLP